MDFVHLRITHDYALSPKDPQSPYFLLWHGKDKDIYWFQNGVVVAWGITQLELASIETFVDSYSIEKLETHHVEKIKYSEGTAAIVDTEHDTLIYGTKNEQDIFSIGLARSVKIDEIEADLEQLIDEVHALKFDRTLLSQKEGMLNCRDKLATLYQLKYKITCNGLLEPPSFLWEHPESSKLTLLLDNLNSFLDLKVRIDIASQKLDLPNSYWSLENDFYQTSHGWRLEVYILILIGIEIILSLLERSLTWKEFYIENFWKNKKEYFLKLFGWPTEFEMIEETIIVRKKSRE